MRPCTGSTRHRSMRRHSIRSGTIRTVVSASMGRPRSSTCRASPYPASMPAESRAVAAISMAWEEPSSMATSRARTPSRKPRNVDDQSTSAVDVSPGVVDAEEETTSPLHTVNVVAWDVPSAIVAGERFRLKVGIKCASECDLTNSDFVVFDHEGTQLTRRTMPGDCWPGTTALYVAEVELEAPAAEGLYAWSAQSPSTALGASPESDVEIPHAEGS